MENRTPYRTGTWIEFHLIMKTAKTGMFDILNKESGYNLGQIKWYGPFRKYSFFPSENCVFETKCLQEIVDFMNELMDARKKAKATP